MTNRCCYFRLAFLIYCLSTTSAWAQSTPAARPAGPPGGPFVNLAWNDSFADAALKLLAVSSNKGVSLEVHSDAGGRVQLTGEGTKETVQLLVMQTVKPAHRKQRLGIDKDVLDFECRSSLSAPVRYAGLDFTVQITFEPSNGLILHDKTRCLMTPQSDFYLPLFIDHVRVELSNPQASKTAIAKNFNQLAAPIEAMYKGYVEPGRQLYSNDESGRTFKLFAYYKQEDASTSCDVKYRVNQSGDVYAEFRFFSGRNQSFFLNLNALYIRHAKSSLTQ